MSVVHTACKQTSLNVWSLTLPSLTCRTALISAETYCTVTNYLPHVLSDDASWQFGRATEIPVQVRELEIGLRSER